jgi:hypothetical protein
MSPQATTAPIRVFISYAWEDDDYRQWVARLATQLREDGVDARLDRWHLQVGQTIPGFMNSEVRSANKVLVLCSPKYRQKVHAMEDGGPSTGVGWESMLLSSAMFTQDARGKAIVALARGEWKESAPDYLQDLPYDDLTQADETHLRRAYTALLRRLTDRSEAASTLGPTLNILAPNSVSPLFESRSLDALATDRSIPPPNSQTRRVVRRAGVDDPTNAMSEETWDIFIAHSSADLIRAEDLFNVLSSHCRVFLASKSLKLGDDWDVKLPEAQRSSQVTVVLVSSRTDTAFYQREEIAHAIELSRRGEHLVVPVYLEGTPSDLNVPYGLRVKHGISLPDRSNNMSIVAEQLTELVTSRFGNREDPSNAGALEQLKSELRPVLQVIRDLTDEGLIERADSSIVVKELLLERLSTEVPK